VTGLAGLHRLVGPYGAVAHRPQRIRVPYNPSWYHIYLTHSARLGAGGADHATIAQLSGSGRAGSAETASRISVVETLERLSSYGPVEEPVVSDARALPDAIDLDSVPRCSARELAHPECPLTRPSSTEPIRWTPGVDLINDRRVWLPSVMVYLGLRRTRAERFWLPISTGAAVGPTWESALTAAICEVIERDMIAILWLQRLGLPRLPGDLVTEKAERLIDWCTRKFVKVHLFDATSEIGIPTVYCVLEAPHDRVAGRIVSCSTNLDVGAAVESAIGEGMSIRPSLHAAVADPSLADSHMSGALEVGRPDRVRGLDFLVDNVVARPGRCTERAPAGLRGDGDRLTALVDACQRAGHSVYAVRLTTPEMHQTGLHAARAIIPSLQPLSFVRRALYLGHPRLYRLPALLGYRVLDEPDLNPDPQPFT
jgi:ribosomal protein S12 methylthiotransferase accessory factor